jgi:hypothetical protein
MTYSSRFKINRLANYLRYIKPWLVSDATKILSADWAKNYDSESKVLLVQQLRDIVYPKLIAYSTHQVKCKSLEKHPLTHKVHYRLERRNEVFSVIKTSYLHSSFEGS